MKEENLKLRHYRAASGLTQEEFCEVSGLDPGTLALYETGKHVPGPAALDRAASASGLTQGYGDEVLQLDETHRRKRLRPGRSPAEIFSEVHETVERHLRQAWRSLLGLAPRTVPPREEDRVVAKQQLPQLAKLTPGQRAAVVRRGRDYHAWALAIEAGEASEEAASRDPKETTRMARLARDFAELVDDPTGWCNAIRSYALAYEGNAARISGRLKEARAIFEEAKRLSEGASDPYGLLDHGRLSDLEASLCRAERRPKEALKLLDRAIAVGRSPGRALIKKGFTLEVMGEYGRAIEVLREAEPKVQDNERLSYMRLYNLAVCLTHVGEFEEADVHLQEVRRLTARRGDEIELIRVTGLEGKILAGLGRRAAGRFYLEQALGQFAERSMAYDVALLTLEVARLLLEEGRTAEVKALATQLAAAFESENVHAEAEKALGLFREAAEREAATVELARQVLSFLFRARHDTALRFTA